MIRTHVPPTRKKSKRAIENYAHTDKERANNPPVGLVTPQTDKDAGRTTYAYDPHINPQLHWAGKAEHRSFEEKRPSSSFTDRHCATVASHSA